MFPKSAWYVACTPNEVDGKPVAMRLTRARLSVRRSYPVVERHGFVWPGRAMPRRPMHRRSPRLHWAQGFRMGLRRRPSPRGATSGSDRQPDGPDA